MLYSRAEVVQFFADRFAEHGDTATALEWSVPGQAVRFNICGQACTIAKSVLDLGCGLGHFAKCWGPNVRYVGIDQCEPMIAHARQTYPTREFRVADLLQPGITLPKADLVVANGVLNLSTGTNESDRARLIGLAYGACRVACAITMLSNLASPQSDGRHYYDGFTIARTGIVGVNGTPRRLVLRHDYLPNDLCLYLYR